MAADRQPLIEVTGLTRAFRAGEDELLALDHIDLAIERGEMVAIIGASGSGKSTLMNILGCLDRPTGGSYRIGGRETADLDADELAALRREHFGFIFQRYHLLAELTAVGNVEIPAIYAGRGGEERHERAVALLSRLGMDDRLGHRPGQLSGGQQQRVSIARALMNGAEVILADEPTGALDSQSGEEVLKILQELNADGKTVIMVTHDPAIAAHANRTIELKDGIVVADTRTEQAETATRTDRDRDEKPTAGAGSLRAEAARFREAFRMAVVAMRAHKVRAFLTMLGIIIGIASVVAVVALGEGSRQKVLANISSLGTNTLEVFPGRDFGDVRSGRITTLVVADANALARQPYVAAVTPTVTTSDTIRFGAEEASGRINGVSDAYFAAEGLKLASGRLFDAESVARRSQDAVIDQNTQSALFKDGVDPVGRVIFVGKVPCRVIGVVEPRSGGFGSSNNPSVYLPYTTVQTRILGDTRLRSITVQVSDDTDTDLAEKAVTKFLLSRHGTKDFFILNTDDIRRTITSTTETLTLLIAAIALISLFVGGIGVMNIMLVSVSERVGEIGVRMAVGARRGDILRQFLIEAVLVCLIGGVLGIAAALGFGALFKLVGSNFTLIYSTTSIVAAFLCSSLIGVAFGYLPARNASRLDPVVALMRD